MVEVSGKTVYILGAGASVHTGAPLLRDFLVRSRNLLESEKDLRNKTAFEEVFEWLDGLRSSAYYVDFDLDNLEHVFSLADMGRQIGWGGCDRIFSSLKILICDTLDHCPIYRGGDQFKPDAIYAGFVKQLRESNRKRMNRVNASTQGFENDTIVTFNYDIALDFAILLDESFDLDYTFEPPKTIKERHLKLLKLHGSTNWFECKECKNFQHVDPHPYPKGAVFSPDSKYVYNFVGNLLPNTKCTECGKVGSLDPFLVPPTWSKAVLGTPAGKIWKQAVNEIGEATQIVVIGYSLPPTDTFFQYLLTLALASNPRLNRVVIVNRDGQELKERYIQIFSKSLWDRNRLDFRFLEKTFHEFVTNGMEGISRNLT
jgi:NAD-dependent SIR2 family protein deacetylase